MLEDKTEKRVEVYSTLFVVDYHTDLSNFYRFYRLLLGGVDYFTQKGVVITLYEVKYGIIHTHQLKDTRKGKK